MTISLVELYNSYLQNSILTFTFCVISNTVLLGIVNNFEIEFIDFSDVKGIDMVSKGIDSIEWYR